MTIFEELSDFDLNLKKYLPKEHKAPVYHYTALNNCESILKSSNGISLFASRIHQVAKKLLIIRKDRISKKLNYLMRGEFL